MCLNIGFDTDNLMAPVWNGGETEALIRLERHLERKAWVATFAMPKMTAQSLMASQTGLSPYLRFGCLSPRLFYHKLTGKRNNNILNQRVYTNSLRVAELYMQIKQCAPPLSLHGQLMWREFFFCAATNNSNFDHMEQNEMCLQIPWQHNPTALFKWANVSDAVLRAFSYEYYNASLKQAQTGFPWIDAIMVQLRNEGWIHQLARHSLICFLTRGHLWLSWEEGVKVFEDLLLDADWSVNAGTCMWMSGSSFFEQIFNICCPVTFGRKADPNGDYIRRYLPVLSVSTSMIVGPGSLIF